MGFKVGHFANLRDKLRVGGVACGPRNRGGVCVSAPYRAAAQAVRPTQ